MRLEKRLSLVIVLALSLVPAQARAEVVTVCGDGTGDFTTIQAAIDAAAGGDEVVVCSGTYDEVINLLGKAITLRSEDGAETTIIDGTGLNDSVIKCISGEGPKTVIEGFTITGGTGDPSRSPDATFGGGLLIDAGAPTLIGCRIERNSVDGPDSRGGGVFVGSGSPTILACTISENSSGTGAGGVYCAGGILVMTNCSIRNNSASLLIFVLLTERASLSRYSYA